MCPITADRIRDIFTDDQCPDDQCSPISATCQCPSVLHISAYQCTSMPHSAHLSCLSVPTISASQCHLSVPVSDTYQSCQSMPPISARQ
ncbi:unnamed protein product, partial [Staurois parvus]